MTKEAEIRKRQVVRYRGRLWVVDRTDGILVLRDAQGCHQQVPREEWQHATRDERGIWSIPEPEPAA